MALWSFTEISEKLDCSPQNIYQKKSKLKNLGYIEIDTDGKEKINENGYNYLLQQRQSTIQNNSNNLNKSLNNDLNKSINSDFTSISDFKQDNYFIDFLQKQIEELKQQLKEEKEHSKYWQDLYIQENSDFKKLVFPIMLNTEDGNKQQEQETRRGFWNKLFKN